MAPVYIILLGPPGVGKSTQGALLSRRYPLVALSTGNLLRAEVQAGTPLGREARAAIESGQLVSDDVIDTMVRTHLNALPASHGFLLDGFPRTAAQAAALDTMLHELHMPLTVVVEPLLERDEVVRRMSSCRECRSCNAPYTSSASDLVRCPACGGELFQRLDDRSDVIRRRLDIYEQQTAPLTDYYRRAGLIAPVDAHGTAEQVAERICTVIELHRLHRRVEHAERVRVTGGWRARGAQE